MLTLADLPNALGCKLPRYPQLPVALLGCFDRSTTSQGLGEHMLLDTLHRSLAYVDQIAGMAALVDAKGDSASSFYRHFGFLSLQAQPSRLFVPIRLLAQHLG